MKQRKSNKFINTLCVLFAVTICGCKEELVNGLSENDANKLLAQLYSSSLDVEKKKATDGTWGIMVEGTDMREAIRFLDSTRSLPTLPEQIPDGGSMVPSREDQIFRYERQLSSSIQRTLESISSVRESRVHLNLPPKDPILGSDKTGAGSASALLIVDKDSNIAPEEVKGLIAGAAGISMDRVAVLIKRSDVTSQKEPLKVSSVTVQAKGEEKLTLGTMMQSGVATALLLAVMVFWFFRRRRIRKEPAFKSNAFVGLEAGR